MLCAIVLAAALAAPAAVAEPAVPRAKARCAAYCLSDADSKFAYKAGFTYVYDYSSDIETKLTGATTEASRLHVTATAELAANSACDFTLRLRDVALSDSEPGQADRRRHVDNMATFKQDLERHPLSFSYQDGRVEELCSSQLESVWALNFKRGVLSAFVNNLETLQHGEINKYETDVSGYCSTDYSVRQLGDVIEVTKTKDLLTCRERGHLVSSLQTTPYHSTSKIQSMPLLRSSLQCRQRVLDGRLLSVVCEESHLFRPFSRGDSGAVTRTTLSLNERQVRPTSPATADDSLKTRSSAMFDHTVGAPQQQGEVDDAASRVLLELVQKTAEDVRPDVPRLFTQLTETLRRADEASLDRLLASLTDKTARKYFVDALPMLGTAAALATMRDMMQQGLVTSDEADRWMTSLAFMHEPQLNMIDAVSPLLADANVRRQTLLGISALIHQYCRRNIDCIHETAVKRAVGRIEKLLGATCTSDSKQAQFKVLAALKALGNAGRLVQGEKILRACFENDNDIEIRLAAIRAYRRMPCWPARSKSLINTFSNQREDIEVRIAAYLSIMQCPSNEVVDKLLEILSKETINQVGSFVWTHITNLQETNDPGKQYTKSLLYNRDLVKKFNTDARKFSRYFEKTMFFESLNAAGSAEGTVIFSPKSYIPRSSILNITVDLFGEAINLLEVGGRVEGLEDYVENLFGRNGPYPQEAVSQILTNIRGRPSSNDINKLSNAYNAANDGTNGFHASTHMKIFGNELSFGRYDNLDELLSSLGANGPLSFLKKLAQKMDWTENYQFLDSSFTIPTISGLPFTLRALGTAAVTLKTSGSVRVENWRKMHIEGYVKPSAAIEIVGEMGVNAQVARTGLKMSTHLHSSSVLDGKLVIDEGRVVSLKINMPRDKLEILDVQTHFHNVYQNQDRELKRLSDHEFKFDACSAAYTETVLGINICSHIRYPLSTETAPGFPFSGPLTARCTVEKTDTVKEFKFEYRHSNDADMRKSALIVDTPGSTVDRRIYLDYAINFRSNAFRVGFVTPVKSIEVSGNVDLEGVTRQARVQLSLDGHEVFGMSGALAVGDSPSAIHYKPRLSIWGQGGPFFNLDGVLSASKTDSTYMIDLQVTTELYENPVVFHGSLENIDGTYSLKTSLSSYALDGELTGTLRYLGSVLILHTITEYSVLKGPHQTISVNTSLGREDSGLGTVYTLFMDTKVSAVPFLNTQLSVEHLSSPGRHKSTMLVRRGRHTYQLGAVLTSQLGRLTAEAALVATHLDIDFKLAAGLDLSSRHSVRVTALARLDSDRFVESDVTVTFLSEDRRFKYGLSTNITLMASNYVSNTEIHSNKKTSQFTFLALRTTPGQTKRIALSAGLGEDADGASTLDLSLHLPDYPTTVVSCRLETGGRGRYWLLGRLQRGSRVYNASAQYRYSSQHVVELRAASPARGYSGTFSASIQRGVCRIKADLSLGRRIMAVVIMRSNSEELGANFEIYWNKDIDDSENAIFSISWRGGELSSSLRYPGRQVHVLVSLTHNGFVASIELAPDQKLVVEGQVSVAAGNNLEARLSVQTPFPGYTSMGLVLRNRPDPPDVSSLLNFEISGNIEDNEVTLRGLLEVDLGLSRTASVTTGSTFKVELELITPFKRWQHSQIIGSYHHDDHSFSARVTASRNEHMAALGAVFKKVKLKDAFKIIAVVDIALPVELVQAGKVGFDLTLNPSDFEVDGIVQWENEDVNTLSTNVKCIYNTTSDVVINSIITLKTPFENMEQLQAFVEVAEDEEMMKFEFTVYDTTNETIFRTHINGFYYGRHLLGGDFSFACTGCPGFGAALEYRLEDDSPQFQLVVQWKNQETTLTGVLTANDEGKKEVFLALLLPNPVRKYELKYSTLINLERKIIQQHLRVSRDLQNVTIDMESRWLIAKHEDNSSTYSFVGIGRVASPFLGWESAQFVQNTTVKTGLFGIELSNHMTLLKETSKIVITDSGHISHWTDWHVDHQMISNTGWFSRVTTHLRSDWGVEKGLIIVSVSWDGQTSKFVLVDKSSQGNNNLLDVSLTAQWLSQYVRRMSLIIPTTTTTWDPSLTIFYAPGKTINIYGSLQKPSMVSDSHLTFKTPFTGEILIKTNHNLVLSKKHFAFELVHDIHEKYNLRVELGTNFTQEASLYVEIQSPRWFLGSNTFNIQYIISSTLQVHGKVTHDDFMLNLASQLGIEDGWLETRTPFDGFTVNQLTYARTPKDMLIRLKSDKETIQVEFADRSDFDMLEYAIEVSTPFRSFRSLVITFTKPMTQNMFSLKFSHNSANKMSINGEYQLSLLQSSIDLRLRTSFTVMPSAQLEVSYSLIDPSAKLLLSKGRYKVLVEASAELSLVSSKFSIEYQNSLLHGPRRATITGTYNVRDSEKRFHMQLVKDSVKYSMKGKARLFGETSYVILDTKSPIPGYELVTVVSRFASGETGPTLIFHLVKNNETATARLQINATKFSGTVRFDVNVPFENNHTVIILVRYDVASNPATFELIAERDSIRNEILGSANLNNNAFHLTLSTPFHGLEVLDIMGTIRNVQNKQESRLILRRNQGKVDVVVRSDIRWLRADISVQAITTIAYVRNIGFDVRYDIDSHTKVFYATLARNEQRLETNISVSLQTSASNAYAILKTPFVEWENTHYSAMYDLRQTEKKIEVTYDKNGTMKVLTILGLFTTDLTYLNIISPFQGYETIGISGQYINDSEKREVGLEAHVNDIRHRLYIMHEGTPREGDANITVRLDTPIRGMHSVEVDIAIQPFTDGVEISMNVSRDGMRSEVGIRTYLGEKFMGMDIEIESTRHEHERITLSGRMNYLGANKTFQFFSGLGKRKMEFSGFLATKAASGVGKITCKLPLPGLEKFSAALNYNMGTNNVFTLVYMKNDKKQQISGSLTHTGTSFSINLRTPFSGFQEINVAAGRTTTMDGAVAAELSLRRGNQRVIVQYMYLFSFKSGDSSIEIVTPFEGFEDMKMALAYKNNVSFRNMMFTARRNSREWNIQSSRRWGDRTEEDKLTLTSPIEAIRSLKVVRSFDLKNLAAMNYHASYERNDRTFTISGIGSIQKEGKKVSLDVSVHAPIDIGRLSANVAYDFSKAPVSLNSSLFAGQKYVKLVSTFAATAGAVEIRTANKNLPKVDITYTANIADVARNISVNLVLADNRTINVVYASDYSRPKQGSGMLTVISTMFDARNMQWNYSRQDGNLNVNVQYNSPDVKVEWSASLRGMVLVQQHVHFFRSVHSDSHRPSTQLDIAFQRRNGLFVKGDLITNGRKYAVVIDKKSRKDLELVTIEYDGPAMKNVKINGTWNFRGARKTMNFGFNHGSKRGSFSSAFQLDTFGKSGKVSVHLKTPFDMVSVAKFDSNWNFASPTRNIYVKYVRNSVKYYMNIRHTQHNKKANILCEITTTNAKLYHGKDIPGIVISASYDANTNLSVRIAMKKPFEALAIIDFKGSDTVTTLKLAGNIKNILSLVHVVDQCHIDLNYTATTTHVGRHIDLLLDTSILNVGKLELSADAVLSSDKYAVAGLYNHNEKIVRIHGEVVPASHSRSGSFRLQTPVSGMGNVELFGSYRYISNREYFVTIDYSQGQRYINLVSSVLFSGMDVIEQLKSVQMKAGLAISCKLNSPIDLSVDVDTELIDIGTTKQSGVGKLEGKMNGQKLGIIYTVTRDDHGRRMANVVITTPHKGLYRKIVLTSDVSLHSSRAFAGIEYGSKKTSLELSWLTGEAGQYGVEIRLVTPYTLLTSLELEARGTLNRDRSVDVVLHYRRDGTVLRVTGTVRPYAVDLSFDTPSWGNFTANGGVVVKPEEMAYSIACVVTLPSGAAVGGEVTLKAATLNDMQFTVDVRTPRRGWERLNIDVAFTDVTSSRAVRVAFQLPHTKRLELSMELTNRGSDKRTDLRAGIVANYLGTEFTFWTNIYRNTADNNATRPDLLELSLQFGSNSFYGKLSSSPQWPMDFLVRLNDRTARIRVFQPNWRTLRFLVRAGPYQYRGNYLIGGRHLEAQMMTFGSGSPQRVQVSIDLESMGSIAMKVTTLGEDGRKRSMVFAYALQPDRFSFEFELSLAGRRRGVRMWLRRRKSSWVAANADVIIAMDELSYLSAAYDVANSTLMLRGSLDGPLFHDSAFEFSKSSTSIRALASHDRILHEVYGSVVAGGRRGVEFRLQSPLLPFPPIAVTADYGQSSRIEYMHARARYGNLKHTGRAQIKHEEGGTVIGAVLDTPLFGLRDVMLDLNITDISSTKIIQAILTAFGEVSRLEAMATVVAPYEIEVDVKSRRLPAGSFNLFGVLDVRSRENVSLNASVRSGNHKSSMVFRHWMIGRKSVRNFMVVTSTVWPISFNMNNSIELQNGFRAASVLTSSIGILPYYDISIDFSPTSHHPELYNVRGHLISPFNELRNIRLTGLIAGRITLLKTKSAFISLQGPPEGLQFHVSLGRSSVGSAGIQCNVKLSGAPRTTEINVRWGTEWLIHVRAEEPFVKFIPRLIYISTDKKSSLTAKVEYRNMTASFDGKFRNSSDIREISLRLRTPLHDYEELGIIGRLETGRKKGVQAEVTFLGNTAGMNADFFIDGFHILARASLHTPFEAFPGFQLDITNNPNLHQLSYEGKILGRIGSYEASIAVKGAYHSSLDAYLDVGAVIGSWFIKNDFRLEENLKKLQMSNVLETSSDAITSLHLAGFYDMSSSTVNFGLSGDVNSISLIGVSWKGPIDRFRLEIENPWQPVVLTGFYGHGVSKTMGLMGIWNLQDPEHNQVGVNITYRTVQQDMLLRLETIVFDRIIAITGKYGESSTSFHNELLFQLDRGHGFGYDISYNDLSQITKSQYSIRCRTRIASRVLSISGNNWRSAGHAKSEAILQWDADVSPDKKMSVFVDVRRGSIWQSWQSRRYNITIGVTHSGLDHDIVLDNSVELYPLNRSLKTTSVLHFTNDSDFDLVVNTVLVNRSVVGESRYDISVKSNQAISGLDVELTTITVYSGMLLAQNLSFSYRNKLFEVEAFGIHAEVDKAQHEAFARLVTRAHDVSLRGSHETSVGVHVLRLISDFDGIRRPLEIRLQTQTPTKPLELRMDVTYEKNRKLFVYLGMPTNRHVSLDASRNLYGMQVNDASLNIRLNSSRLLSAVLQWRWQMAVDVKRRAVARFTALSADVQSWLADITRFVRDEAARKERFIQPVLNRKWIAVAAYTRGEYDAVMEDFRSARSVARRMFERDDLFMRTIYGIIRAYLHDGRHMVNMTTIKTQQAMDIVKTLLRSVTKDLLRSFQLLIRAFKLFISAVRGYIKEEIATVYELAVEIGEAVELLFDTVQGVVDAVWSSVTSLASSAWDGIVAAWARLFATTLSTMSPMLDWLRAGVTWMVHSTSHLFDLLARSVREVVAEIKEALQELAAAFVTQLLDIFYINTAGSSAPEWIHSVPGVEFLGVVATATKSVLYYTYANTVLFIQYNQEFLTEAWTEAKSLMSQIRDDVTPVKILFEWFQRISSRTSWAWKYWEEGNQVRRVALWVVDALYDRGDYSNETTGLQLTDNAVLKYFPWDGYIEANVYLPVDWENFNRLPNLNPEEVDESTDLSFDVTYFYYELLDYMNRVSPVFTTELWLPPHDTHALIAGSQHFLTFDNKFYEFAGSCSYLLAADLKNLSFALVINYAQTRGRAVRRSLTAMHGNDTLRLVEGKSLFLNDRRVELPYRLGSSVVFRNGSRTILDSGYIRIECNVVFDVCSFRMAGQFHGKTGGLLGTYTNEAADDFTSPSGQLFTRTDSFARTWEVPGKRRTCPVKNLAIRAPGDDARATVACKALFDEPSSVLRPCYGVVSSEPFMRMCLNDLEANYNSPGRYLSVCTSAAAYVAACAASAVDIWMPPACVRCDLEDGHVLQAAQTKVYRHNAPRLADVVLVVERKSCQVHRSFRRVLRSMDDLLKRRGIKQNKFAIIGYGGEGIYNSPHIKTVKGNIWGNSRSAGRALDQLRKTLSSAKTSESSAIFAAIREACMLPFRGGVSKQIVVFSCSKCPYLEHEFPFTIKVLDLMDVKLHIVADTQFRLKKASHRYDSNIVALGASMAYTTKHLQNHRLIGDSRLHPHVTIPKDLCSPLAIETNGTIFDGRRWSKQLRDLMADVVAGAADPSTCQECDCFADRDGVGKLECRTCISRSLQALLADFEAEFDAPDEIEWIEDYEDLPQNPENG